MCCWWRGTGERYRGVSVSVRTQRYSNALRRAWTAADGYEAVVASITSSGMGALVRGCIGVSVVLVAIGATLLLAVDGGPELAAGRAILIADNVIALIIGVSWLIAPSWPSRRGSLIRVYAMCTLYGISLFAIGMPLVGLVGSCAYAALAAYVSLFHSVRHLTVILVVAGMVVAVLYALVVVEHRAMLGLFICTIAAVTIVTVPFGQQVAILVLRDDAAESDHDPLTRALNRRGLERHFDLLMRGLSADVELRAVVIAIDLDDFKRINDTYGHGTGDGILCDVVRAIGAVVSPRALVARTGGEEFAVVCPQPSLERVEQIGDLIRQSIAESSPQYEVRASVGLSLVALWPASSVSSSADVLTAALTSSDVAMYRAKRAGGNRVEWA